MMKFSTVRTSLLIAVILLPIGSQAQEIDWLIAPYGWLPAITLEQSGGSGGGGGGGLGGSSLLDMTDSFFKFRAEAARNRWGVMLDYITLSLSDETTLAGRPYRRFHFSVARTLKGDHLPRRTVHLRPLPRPLSPAPSPCPLAFQYLADLPRHSSEPE